MHVQHSLFFYLESRSSNQGSNRQDLSQEKLTELEAEPEGWWPQGRTDVHRTLQSARAYRRGCADHQKHFTVGSPAHLPNTCLLGQPEHGQSAVSNQFSPASSVKISTVRQRQQT